jgi:hypothetical protein
MIIGLVHDHLPHPHRECSYTYLEVEGRENRAEEGKDKMSDMVERVAIAIHGAIGDIGIFESFDEAYKSSKRSAARAAIEAMREPTDGMVSFMLADYRAVYANDARDNWRAMIDEALK